MKVLVTGGGGFLGRYMVELLVARGDEVRVLCRGAYPFLDELGVEVHRGDVADPATARRACEGRDLVFHVAAKAGFWGPYDGYFQANVVGSRNIVAGCKAAGVEKLVYTSTPSVVVGRQDLRGVDESCPVPDHHDSPYGATKAIAEREVLAAHGDDLLVAAIRPHLIFGPRDNHIVPRLVDRARAGKLVMVGDGTNQVTVNYVENVAAGHLQLADALAPDAPCAGKVYFVGQPEPVNLWDFVNRILEGFGIPRLERRLPLGVASTLGLGMELGYRILGLSGEPRMTRWLAHELATDHWFDCSAATRDWGYEAAVSTDEGLARLFAAGLDAA